MSFDETQLREFAQEHIRYELVTLVEEVRLLHAFGHVPPTYAYVALAEAPLVHVRLLHEFLGKRPSHKDVAAEHYRPGRNLTPVLSDGEYDRISQHVVHLSMLRQTPVWNLGELARRARDSFRAFLRELETDPSEEVRRRRSYFDWPDPDAAAAMTSRLPSVVHATTSSTEIHIGFTPPSGPRVQP